MKENSTALAMMNSSIELMFAESSKTFGICRQVKSLYRTWQ